MPQEKPENTQLQEPEISPNIEGWDIFFCACLLALAVCIYPKSEFVVNGHNEPTITSPNHITILAQKLEKLKLQIPKSF